MKTNRIVTMAAVIVLLQIVCGCGLKYEIRRSNNDMATDGTISSSSSTWTQGISTKERSPIEEAKANEINARAMLIKAYAENFKKGLPAPNFTNKLSNATGKENFQNIPGFSMVSVQNATSNYAIEVNSDPFNGLHLGPGKTSAIPQPIAYGRYTLVYTWYKLGGNSSSVESGTNTLTGYIDERISIIIVKQ